MVVHMALKMWSTSCSKIMSMISRMWQLFLSLSLHHCCLVHVYIVPHTPLRGIGYVVLFARDFLHHINVMERVPKLYIFSYKGILSVLCWTALSFLLYRFSFILSIHLATWAGQMSWITRLKQVPTSQFETRSDQVRLSHKYFFFPSFFE